jgi:predicted tellurium resistance membrane protein TerC
MECNIGTTEKIIRFLLGFIFLWLGLQFNALFYILAIIFFATAAIGFCPVNKTLGINTCKAKKKNEEKSEEIKKEEVLEEPETQDSQNTTEDNE